MADPGEFNPKKTTAPGSDNAEGRGSSFDPSPDWDKDILQEFNKQQEIQEKQTKALKELSERLIANNEALQSARKKQYEAEIKNDQEALELAKKQIFIEEQFQNENLQNIDRLEKEMLKQQENIDAAIDLLGESVGKNDIYVKRHLKIEEDAKQIIKHGLDKVVESETSSSEAFKQFIEDFNTQHLAELEFEAQQNKLLGDKIAAASTIPEISGTDDEKISAMMQRTSLNLESLATINEKIADEMTAEGIDKEDKAAVERFKMERMMDTKFNESIIKELIKSRDSIKKETVQKELQEKYIRQGIPAAMAAVRAEKNAEAETKKRRAEAAEQIRIFKKMDETQRYQTTLVEADYRHRLEREKEEDGIPEWYLRLEKSLSPINAALEDLRDAYSKSGLFMKVLMVLALLGGIIVGAIVTAVKKVIDVFKAGGAIAEWFAGIRNSVPMIDKMIRALGRMFTWMAEGNVIGRFFVNIFSKVVSGVTYVVNAFKQLGTGLRVLEAAGKEGGIVMRFLAAAARPLVNLMKAFQFGFSIGAGAINLVTKALSFLAPILRVVGKLFLPLTIALTVIDGIIGAFKGFNKDGFKGIVVGAISQIIASITGLFGINFDKVYGILMGGLEGFGEMLGKGWVYVTDWLKGAWKNVTNWLGKVGDVLKWANPLYLMYRGVKSLYDNSAKTIKDLSMKVWDTIKWANPFSLMYRGVKWLYDGGAKTIKDWSMKVWDVVKWGNPIYLFYQGATTLAKKIKSLMPETIQNALDEIQSMISSVWDGIKGMFGSILSWIGIDIGGKTAEAMPKAEAKPKTTAKPKTWEFVEDEEKELDEFENFEVGSSSRIEKTGAIYSNDARVREQAKQIMDQGSRGAMGNVQNNTTVNNVRTGGGGGKPQQPPTIIAPQPPRNTEPTLRAMQFGEQPAF
jgi:hypothetical protein